MRGYYDAGNSDRLNSGWVPVNGSAEQVDHIQRDVTLSGIAILRKVSLVRWKETLSEPVL